MSQKPDSFVLNSCLRVCIGQGQAGGWPDQCWCWVMFELSWVREGVRVSLYVFGVYKSLPLVLRCGGFLSYLEVAKLFGSVPAGHFPARTYPSAMAWSTIFRICWTLELSFCYVLFLFFFYLIQISYLQCRGVVWEPRRKLKVLAVWCGAMERHQAESRPEFLYRPCLFLL